MLENTFKESDSWWLIFILTHIFPYSQNSLIGKICTHKIKNKKIIKTNFLYICYGTVAMAVFELNVDSNQITGSSSTEWTRDFTVPAPKSVYLPVQKRLVGVYDYGAVVYLEQPLSLVLIEMNTDVIQITGSSSTEWAGLYCTCT